MASPTEVDERVDECSSHDESALLESEQELANCESDCRYLSDELAHPVCLSREPVFKSTASTDVPSRLPARVYVPKPATVKRKSLSQKLADILPQEFILWLGVILPSSVIAMILVVPPSELGIDALPTPWHFLWVSLVPASNFLIWRRQWYGRLRSPAWLVHLNSLATGISLIYTLRYLHFVLMGLVMAFFLIGLWALAPALALACSLACRGYLHGARVTDEGNRLPTLSLGLTLALLLLGLPFLPAISTEYGLHLAVSDSQPKRLHGLTWLRRFGSHVDLLKSCYRESDVTIQWLGAAVANEQPANAEQRRKIYYRVTGQPLQSETLTADSWHTRWRASAGFDQDTGGTRVGQAVEGLSLRTSRMEVFVDPTAMLASIEWTLVMRNESWRNSESRAEIALPPGGVISRVTLWVNGKEREAAVAEEDKVRKAYQEVVRQRRDPILVTMSGRDRVLVQCFPVPPNGGEMKFRLHIAAPLQLDSATQGFVRWPYLVEQNFNLGEQRVHSVQVQANAESLVASSRLLPLVAGSSTATWEGKLANSDLSSTQSIVSVLRQAGARIVWTPNPLDKKAILWQSVEERTVPRPKRIILVLDSSSGMSAHLVEVANSLDAFPPGVELGVLIASDAGADLLTPVQTVTPQMRSALSERIRGTQCEGGRSNVAGLLQAWDLAGASDAGMVVWVHGPIRELTDAPEPFLDRWLEVRVKPRFLDIQTESGPNRLLERLGAAEGFDSVTRRWSLSEDLRRILAVNKRKSIETTLVRGSSENEPGNALQAFGPTAWAMTCLWAHDRISSLLRAEVPDSNAALGLAKKYHVVSPVTGAVVLETDEQYIRAGLGSAPPLEVAPAGSRENVSFFPSRGVGLASGGSEIGFDLRSSWDQSGTPYDGLILFPVTLFLFARLLLGGPMIRIPFEETRR
jgi:Vault protein inter-alpha-trypsin domain